MDVLICEMKENKLKLDVEILLLQRDIVVVKSQLIENKLARMSLVQQQKYEEAAEWKDKEKLLVLELQRLKFNVKSILEKYIIEIERLESIPLYVDLLHECNSLDTQPTITMLQQQFVQSMRLQFEQLCVERKELLNKFKLTEAKKLEQFQIELGKFLFGDLHFNYCP